MPAYLGIDIGTAGAKGCLIDDELRVLGTTQRLYRIETPRAGWVEQNPLEWLSATASIIEELSNIAPIRAISISSQGDTIVPVDPRGKPLRPAISWMDSRCISQCKELREKFSEEAWHRITGQRLLPFLAITKIMWTAQEQKEVAEQTSKFLFAEDFVSSWLTGNYVVSTSNATRSGLCDISTAGWETRLLELAGITEDKLSRVAPSATLVGTVREDRVSAPCSGTEVFTGGHDQTCAGIGAGVTEEGECLLSCGSAWVVLAPLESLSPSAPPKLTRYSHCVPDRWVLLGAYAGGNVLKWFLNNLSESVMGEARKKGADPYEVLIRPGEVGDFSFSRISYGALTPVWRAEARGALLGLQLHHTRADIARALLLGVAFETAWNVEALRDCGVEVFELTMVGGGARSKFWAQLVADSTGLPVLIPKETEGASLGAGIIAGIGAGGITWQQTREWKPETEFYIEPDASRAERLEPLFEFYKKTFFCLLDIFTRWQGLIHRF